MTKRQKILAWIFLALAVVPEILWSPILNSIYQIFQTGNARQIRSNFLLNADNIFYLKIILLVQFISSIILTYIFIKAYNKNIWHYIAILLCLLFLIISLVVLYTAYALSGISF